MDEKTQQILSQILLNTEKISTTLEEHNTRLQNLEHNVEEIKIEHGKRLENLEYNIENLKNIVEKLKDKVENLENKVQNLEDKVESLENKVQNLENTVTRMEFTHGEKLQVLFDYFTTDSERFEKIKQEISTINSTLDKHDNRIYFLEFHLPDCLSIK